QLARALPVDAEGRAERTELEPACEQFIARSRAPVHRTAEVTADIRGPVRHAGERVVEPGRYLLHVSSEVGVDVAGPDPGRVTLQARECATRQDIYPLAVRSDLAPALVQRAVVLQRI